MRREAEKLERAAHGVFDLERRVYDLEQEGKRTGTTIFWIVIAFGVSLGFVWVALLKLKGTL